MKTLRLLWWFGFALMFTFGVAILVNKAHADDANFIFKQPKQVEYVTGWKAKISATKGGPYTTVHDCKKPPANSDGSYTCVVPIPFSPIYGIVVNYNSEGTESGPTNEVKYTVPLIPPTDLKIVVTVTTTSKLTRYGNPVATTTIKRVTVPSDKVVKEGTSGYWNSRKREYVTNTVIISQS